MREALLLAFAVACTVAPAAQADDAVDRAGAALLEVLSEDERRDATWSFDHAEREDVHFAPFGLDGVRLGKLSPEARLQVEALVASVLSRRGVETLRTVRELERAVRQLEEPRFWSFLTRRIRDPQRYLLALFGDPAGGAPWGFRLEGHHLSLNVTAAPGRPASVTPFFLGAQPRSVPEGWPLGGVALLGTEERLARQLFDGLSSALQDEARLPFEGGRSLLLGDVARGAEGEGRGLPRAAMPEAQREELDALVERFLGLFSEPVARMLRTRMDAAGRDRLRFAWSAGDEATFYARVEGPTLLLEIDNSTDGDHVHAVLHDLEDDFGDDLLARHLRDAHGLDAQAP